MLHSPTDPQGLLKDSSDSSGLLRTPPAVLQQSFSSPQGVLKKSLRSPQGLVRGSPYGSSWFLKESSRSPKESSGSPQGVLKESSGTS